MEIFLKINLLKTYNQTLTSIAYINYEERQAFMTTLKRDFY